VSNPIPARNSAADELPDFGRRNQESMLISPNYLENGFHLAAMPRAFPGKVARTYQLIGR